MLPFSVVLLQQIHCYPIGLLRYHGNATNSLLCNSKTQHVTIYIYIHTHTQASAKLIWASIYKTHTHTNGSMLCITSLFSCKFLNYEYGGFYPYLAGRWKLRAGIQSLQLAGTTGASRTYRRQVRWGWWSRVQRQGMMVMMGQCHWD
jgi:hypothetical protein